MKTSPRQNGMQTGVAFGVIIVTMFLIGFTIIGSQLIGKVLGNEASSGMPAVAYFAIFMILIGLWCGSMAAKKPVTGSDNLKDAMFSGLIAGLICGMFAALIGFIFGSLAVNKIDVRSYLVSVSPESIKLFLYDQEPVVGSLLMLVSMVLSSLVGSTLACNMRTNGKYKTIVENASSSIMSLFHSPQINALAKNKFARNGLLILSALVMIILPRTWGGYWNYVFGTVGIYIILGLGLNIITGWAGQLVIGYVAFFAIGAYTFGLLTAPSPHHLEWNFWVALSLGVIAAGISGLLVGLPILNLRGDYLAIVTLGFAEIIRILLKSDLMTPFTGGPRGLQNISGPTLFGRAFSSDIDFMYLIIIAVLVVSFLAYRLQNSRPGRAWMAINLDETVARATGVNAFASKLLALTLSAAVAGLAGALFASRNQYTGPDDHALMVAINVLCLVIVGGIGNIPGIFLGAFALKGLPEVLREIENYRMLVFGILLIIMMRIRPEGFLPAKRPSLEFDHPKPGSSPLASTPADATHQPGKEI